MREPGTHPPARVALLCSVGFALLLGACGAPREAVSPEPAAPEHAAFLAQRMIEPQGGRSTAGLPRVQIGTETRTVVGAQPQVIVRWQSPIIVDGDVEIVEAVPEALRGVQSILVEASASIEAPAMRDAEGAELARVKAPRRTYRSGPVRITPSALDAPEAEAIALRIAIEGEARAALAGAAGLVDVVARPLADSPLQRWVFAAIDVGPADILRFGYGIEAPSQAPGSPPVRFSVRVRRAGAQADEWTVVFSQSRDPARDARDRRWHDASVPLGAFSGERVDISFEAEALATEASPEPRSLAVFSNPVVVPGPVGAQSPPPGHARAPNVILVSLDTLRARSMSAYGYARPTTPVFDARVAGEGALVAQAITPFPFTPPSHMSMLSGLDVCAHGVETRDDVLSAERVTLAEALRDAGYRTAAFTENAYVVAGAGFARGFDTYFEEQSEEGEEGAAPGFAPETFEHAARFIGDVDARPFFLFVHTYQVHGPYTPPRAYEDLFTGPAPDARTRKHARALDDYEREVRYTDALLGAFLDVLAARGLAEETIVIVTSDHGEQFGEHFFTSHGLDLHDEALHVPLAIRAPGLVEPGLVLEQQIGLMDIAPTLLDLLGVEALPDVQGLSFAPMLRGEAGDASAFAQRALIGKASHSRSVRQDGFKYMVGTGASQWEKLYDLANDPDERRETAASQPERVARGRALLATYDDACSAWLEAHPPTRAEGGAGHARPGWMLNRDEIERKLRSLGYIE